MGTYTTNVASVSCTPCTLSVSAFPGAAICNGRKYPWLCDKCSRVYLSVTFLIIAAAAGGCAAGQYYTGYSCASVPAGIWIFECRNANKLSSAGYDIFYFLFCRQATTFPVERRYSTHVPRGTTRVRGGATASLQTLARTRRCQVCLHHLFVCFFYLRII